METRGDGPEASAARGSATAGVIAAAAPFAASALTVTGLLWPALSRRGVGALPAMLHEGGRWSLVAIGLALLSTLACAAWLGLSAYGRRGVPVAALVALAGLPWLVSSAGAWRVARVAEAAAASVEPELRATVLAQATAEALYGGILGAAWSAGLLLGGALGLTVCALAGREVSKDLHGAIPATLALAAGVQVVDQLDRARLFEALASVAPEQRAAVLARGLIEGMTVHRLHEWSWVLVALAVVGVGAWSWSRARPSPRGYLDTAATIGVAAALLGASVLGAAGTLRPLARALETGPTTAFAGIELPRSRATTPLGEAIQVTLAIPLDVRVEGASVRLDGVEAALATHAERLRTIAAMNPRRSFRGEIELAADRRFEVGSVLDVLRAAGRAGFVHPRLAVRSERGAAPRQIELLPPDAPVEGSLALRIELGPASARVCGSGGCLARGCAQVTETVAPSVGSVGELGACLAQVQRQFPDERVATIAVARDVTYQHLVDALDATRSVFPDVRLTTLADGR